MTEKMTAKPDKASELAREIARKCHARCYSWSRLPQHDLSGTEQIDILTGTVAALLREAMPDERWIPVSERLPTLSERVLGVFPSGHQEVVVYEGVSWFGSDGEAFEQPRVTHWRPLPAPPAEPTEGE